MKYLKLFENFNEDPDLDDSEDEDDEEDLKSKKGKTSAKKSSKPKYEDDDDEGYAQYVIIAKRSRMAYDRYSENFDSGSIVVSSS